MKLDSLFNLQGESAESFTPPAIFSSKESGFQTEKGRIQKMQ